MNPPTVKLSCQQCRRRKTKCDKNSPCSACLSSGIGCTTVQRARLPRGRSGMVTRNKATVLESRVASLETLVKQLEGQVNDGSAETLHEVSRSTSAQPSGQIGQFVARDFWLALSQEVANLRDTLADSDDDEAQEELHSTRSDYQFNATESSKRILFNISNSLGDSVPHPPPEHMRTILLDLYQHRVDCLFKAIHWPTASVMIINQYKDSRVQSSSTSLKALEFAVYYTAICSLSNEESWEILGTDRSVLLQEYRSSVEIWISRADILIEPDMTVLQAFVLYILGLRSSFHQVASWTLLATAVRVARSLGLPIQDSEGWSYFDMEVGRRLWFCIGLLDSQASLDRGSVPLLSSSDFTHLPSMVDDSELLSTGIPPTPSQSFTDMSFSYVIYLATVCSRKLSDPLAGFQGSWNDWYEKIRTVTTYEESMKMHCSRISESKDPLAFFTRYAAEDISLNMHLLLRRPPYRSKHSPVPPWDKYDFLSEVTKILESGVKKSTDAAFGPWVWFAKSWVKWHALAVLLAELCTPREDKLADRAYAIAQESYDQYSELIRTNRSDMLWKPISKLMKRVREVRGTPRESRGVGSTSFDLEISGLGDTDGQAQFHSTTLISPAVNMQAQSANQGQVFASMSEDPFFSKDLVDVWMTGESGSQEKTNYEHSGEALSWLNWDFFLGDASGSNNFIQ